MGVTTDSVDARIHNYIISHNAYPSPLLYHGFPKACCTSINNVVTHGIPDEFSASPAYLRRSLTDPTLLLHHPAVTGWRHSER